LASQKDSGLPREALLIKKSEVWRRRESNPRPKNVITKILQACLVFRFPLNLSSQQEISR